MPEETVVDTSQAQGQVDAASTGEIPDETTLENTPLDYLDDAGEMDDPLADFPGADAIPDDQKKGFRDTMLRKFNELTEAKRAAEEREAQYMQAIQNLQNGNSTPDDDPNMTEAERSAVQRVRQIAQEAFQEQMQELGLVDKVEQTGLGLQLAIAKDQWPELDKYQDDLNKLDRLLESRLGKKASKELAVIDKMDFLMGAKMRLARNRKRSRPKAPTVQSPRVPQSPSSVDQAAIHELSQFRGKDATRKAYEYAKKKLGIIGDLA